MLLIELVMQSASLEPIANGDFSFWSLFTRADWVVKAVMIILVAASFWSWGIAVDKAITMFLLKRRATALKIRSGQAKLWMSFQQV